MWLIHGLVSYSEFLRAENALCFHIGYRCPADEIQSRERRYRVAGEFLAEHAILFSTNQRNWDAVLD
jgi:hypothetical protein